MSVTVRITQRPERTLRVQAYIPEVIRGLSVTTRQMLRNLFGGKDVTTIQYPEVKRRYPERYRGLHRLMHRDDGQVRCVACMCCSTACPANCIHIVAGDRGDGTVEKYPVSFEIDLLVCVYCGMCEEACPCDAIRMDTKIAVLAADNRKSFVIDKGGLLDWNPADYPAGDTRSQEAPGGLRHAEALTAFTSGEHH
jgi:NADH-quinone oxidoreductase subunit I